MNQYSHLSREELIRLLEARESPAHSDIPVNHPDDCDIKQIISNVLTLLLESENNDSICGALEILLSFFDADWGYIGYFHKNNQATRFLYEVSSAWLKLPQDNPAMLPVSSFPWICKTLLKGKDIILNELTDIPETALADRHMLQEQGVKSSLIIPLTFNMQIRGFIGFDSVRTQRTWSRVEIEDMHIIAKIISIIIERMQAKNNIKISQAQLLKSNTRFKLFFEKLPIGVELYDIHGTLIDTNDAATEIFGTEKEYMLGINLFKDPNYIGILEKIRSGTDFSFPVTYRFQQVIEKKYYPTRLGDQIKYLQINGISLQDNVAGRIGYLLTIIDTTESHLRTEQIENHLALLKAALLSGRSIVTEYDVAQATVFVDPQLNEQVNNNPFFNVLRTTGHLQDLIRSLDVPGKCDADTSESILTQLLLGKRQNYSGTHSLSVNEQTYWFTISAQSYKIKKNSKPDKIVCYITDVTEEKEIENKLHEAENESRRSELEMQKALEADKLKSQFLANMSHEIRTPLNAIVGFSGIIAETEDAQERRQFLDIIQRNNDLLLQLITDILDFSKIESGIMDYQPNEINLKDICSELYMVHVIKTAPEVTLLYTPELLPDITLYTDAKRITQVISNLLSNAVKFTSRGSITLAYEEQPDRVRIRVTDTGIGISPEYRESIFERFVKIDNFKQGTGLGLPICKTIVEMLGGEIGLDSVPGEGSTFWFTLPLTQRAVLPAAPQQAIQPETLPTPPAPAATCGGPHTVLVAEDVEENFYLLQILFGKQYRLLHARNGREAIEMYQRHQPELILMDIKMPIMDGFEATCKIRQLSLTVPIIALTAYAFEKDKQIAQACRFNDYLVKPLHLPDVKKLLRRYLDQRND